MLFIAVQKQHALMLRVIRGKAIKVRVVLLVKLAKLLVGREVLTALCAQGLCGGRRLIGGSAGLGGTGNHGWPAKKSNLVKIKSDENRPIQVGAIYS
jgi:hypothetical protein